MIIASGVCPSVPAPRLLGIGEEVALLEAAKAIGQVFRKAAHLPPSLVCMWRLG